MVDEAKTRTIRADPSRPQRVTATRHEKSKYTSQRHAAEWQPVESSNHNQGSSFLFVHWSHPEETGNRKLKQRVRIERAIWRPPPRDLPTQPPTEFSARRVRPQLAPHSLPLLTAPPSSFIAPHPIHIEKKTSHSLAIPKYSLSLSLSHTVIDPVPQRPLST